VICDSVCVRCAEKKQNEVQILYDEMLRKLFEILVISRVFHPFLLLLQIIPSRSLGIMTMSKMYQRNKILVMSRGFLTYNINVM
jgi:hypothetical protein